MGLGSGAAVRCTPMDAMILIKGALGKDDERRRAAGFLVSGPCENQGTDRKQGPNWLDVPPEDEWLANITKLKTRRAYKEDVREFVALVMLQLSGR
jgi:hypothetical protein